MNTIFKKKILMTLAVGAPATGLCATTITKIGKLRVAVQSIARGHLRVSRQDVAPFAGCTVDPQYVYNLNTSVDTEKVLQLLVAAKQADTEVAITYTVLPNGRCSLLGVEMQ